MPRHTNALIFILFAAACSSAPAAEDTQPTEPVVADEGDGPATDAPDDASDGADEGDGAPGEAGPLDADGEYLNTHDVYVDPDTEETASVSDCFTMETLGSGEVEFAFELNFDMDHSCGMSGSAFPKDGKLVYQGGAESDDAECLLEILVDGENITLREPTQGCTPVWCGARGAIDGMSFARSTRRDATGTCGP